jgi:hypothetical protein
MVLSLGTGAFLQQSIRTVSCNISVPGSNATIAVAQYAHPWLNDTKINWSSWDLGSSTKTRIISALSSRNVTRPMFAQNCTTGNCTFSPLDGVTHITSGFCSRCVETTNSLQYSRDLKIRDLTVGSVLRLENSPSLLLAFEPSHAISIGMAVNADEKALEALLGLIPNDPTAAINVVSLTEAVCSPGTQCSNVWNETRVWKSVGWQNYNVVSVSCGLYPCARHMTAEVKNGEFRETVLREVFYGKYRDDRTEYIGKDFDTTHRKPVAFQAPCWMNGTRYDKPSGNMTVTTDLDSKIVNISQCAFGVSQAFNYEVQKLIKGIASGNCSVSTVSIEPTCRADEMLDDDICRTQPGSPICSAERWWLQNLYNSGLASFESISNTMDNVAMAITDSARAQPFPGVSYVPGTIWHTTICTEFNWPWLIFPAALIILAALSLASTTLWIAWDQDKAPVWKSSILPLILQDELGRRTSTESSSIKVLEQDADEKDLVLERDNGRWKFKVDSAAKCIGR